MPFKLKLKTNKMPKIKKPEMHFLTHHQLKLSRKEKTMKRNLKPLMKKLQLKSQNKLKNQKKLLLTQTPKKIKMSPS